jgi:retron-type reverse transcriptase
LHHDLKEKTYQHGGYKHFKIADPKPRDIHKASVRDRLLHHAIYRVLYTYFDKKFIYDSYSCRNGKGTHKAIQQFQKYVRKVSHNHTKTCYVLKCDIKKFFASIDHTILISILQKHIKDQCILWLLNEVVKSFDRGLPLGNLTSQLLVNIYMNELDQHMKQTLKIKYYIRYADDFIILSRNRDCLFKNLQSIGGFLEQKLKLSLHPDKVFLTTFASGVDFLGWVHFPTHRVLRTSTKRRMLRRAGVSSYKEQTIASYLGMLEWGNGWKLSNYLKQKSQ